ncbi:MAG: S-layer protein [Theionarchaea archaeon]|nr:S-layer protein [Theionarchaea archaeon]
MNQNCRRWGILVIFSLVLAVAEVSSNAAPGNLEHHIAGNYKTIKFLFAEEKTTKYSITGEKGDWEIEIIRRKSGEPESRKDTIKIKYTPKKNETTCKNICFVQTVTLAAYDSEGNKVASNIDEIYTDLMYNIFYKHTKDDEIEDNSNIVVVDHLECEGDPFTNGDDTLKDGGSKGSTNPLTSANFEDTPGITVGTRDKKKNIVKVVQIFEISAICADTGEILGSITWKSVSTETDYGEIELTSEKESKPTKAFEKALRKFVKTHSRTKQTNGVGVTRWYCPETSPIIEGPGGIFSDPWGNPIPEGFLKKWLTSEETGLGKDPCGGTFFLKALEMNLIIQSEERMYTEDLGVKSGKELNLHESGVGGGQYFESPKEALEAGLANSGGCAIKFTWSGDQTKIVGGILFTSFRAISPEDISPFVDKKGRFINDFSALEARFVPAALMQHLLDVMTGYAESLQSSTGPVTVSIIANVGTEEAVAYTGALMPEDVALFVREAAMHETVNQDIVEVLHYIGLNFGLLLGSVNVPPTEFFINVETGQSKVIIVVGEDAAEKDGVSAQRLAAEISAMLFDAPDIVVMTDAEFSFADWKVAGDYNLILVGGPVANSITKILVDEGFSSTTWVTSSGEWEYITDTYSNDCDILVVAGEDRDATYSAAQLLIQWL